MPEGIPMIPVPELLQQGSRAPPLGYPDLLVPIDFSDDEKAPGYLDISPLLPYLSMTGTGFRKDEWCGSTQTFAGFCNNKPAEHRPVLVPFTCGRRACPECWMTWADRAGHRVRDVVNGYLTARYGPVQKISEVVDLSIETSRDVSGVRGEGLRAPRAADPATRAASKVNEKRCGYRSRNEKQLRYLLPRHVSWHPPREVLEDLVGEVLEEIMDPAQFQTVFHQKFRRLAQAVILEAGATGGIYIPHDIRLRKDRATTRADRELDTDRYRAILDRADWREHVKYWPHAHGLLFGPLENAKDFQKRTGWTYRVHRVVSDPDPLVHYLLSHSIAPETKQHVVIPFGDLKRLEKLGEHRCRRHVLCDACTEEGRPEDQAYRVVGRLLQGSLSFEHDLQPEARLRHGRGKLQAWGVEDLTDKHFVRTHRVGVFRLRAPGEKRTPKPIDPREEGWSPGKAPAWHAHIKYHTEENWKTREASAEIPGDWFSWGGPPGPPGGVACPRIT